MDFKRRGVRWVAQQIKTEPHKPCRRQNGFAQVSSRLRQAKTALHPLHWVKQGKRQRHCRTNPVPYEVSPHLPCLLTASRLLLLLRLQNYGSSDAAKCRKMSKTIPRNPQNSDRRQNKTKNTPPRGQRSPERRGRTQRAKHNAPRGSSLTEDRTCCQFP